MSDTTLTDHARTAVSADEAPSPATADEARAREASGDSSDERGLRFDDPYWDDAFCAWWDPSLRTCC